MNVRKSYVYILADKPKGVLYVGSSLDLKRRIARHKNESLAGFTKKYHVHNLVYYEQALNSNEALKREMKLKRWKRKWKIELIEKMNPGWKDLYDKI